MKRYNFGNDPRAIAAFVCHAVNGTGQRAKQLLESELERTGFARRDRDLTTELVYGSLRRRGTLDHVLGIFSSTPLRKVQPRVLELLRLGAYQLLFLDKIPPSAAVNEAVRSAKRVSSEGAAGFVNGCLRSLGRGMVEKTDAPGSDPRKALPLGEGAYCLFRGRILPDPAKAYADYLAAAYSHPVWLVRRWLRRRGDGVTRQLCEHDNATPNIMLRVNTLRTTQADLVAELMASGRWARPAGTGHVVISHEGALGDLPALRDGRCTVQGVAASAAVPLLAPQKGERVLDLCAAPGSKACQMAELAANDITVLALDISPRRLRQVADNARRLGARGVMPVAADGTTCDRLVSQPCDAALVDVPCSNTGVLSRRVESRWRLSEARIRELADLQLRLLAAAARAVRPGGRIVYSTCSLEPEENEGVVERLCQSQPDCELAQATTYLPHETKDDGGYIALLRRKE